MDAGDSDEKSGDRVPSEDDTTVRDDITLDISSSDNSSDNSSDISNLDDTYTGSSSEDRPQILPHEVPDIQIQEASSNQQSLESLSYVKNASESDESDTESSMSREESTELTSSESSKERPGPRIVSTELSNASAEAVSCETEPREQNPIQNTPVMSPEDDETHLNLEKRILSRDIPKAEISEIELSTQDNSPGDEVVVIGAVTCELKLDRDLDKDIDTLETENDRSTADDVKLRDTDETTISVAYSEDTMKSRYDINNVLQ